MSGIVLLGSLGWVVRREILRNAPVPLDHSGLTTRENPVETTGAGEDTHAPGARITPMRRMFRSPAQRTPGRAYIRGISPDQRQKTATAAFTTVSAMMPMK
ncbi:hypothetical protein GCM10025331_30560 [Actinoplanes utahensis]|nr:hypothetical protein Aut01nite_32280 [Actinoplanes utahensis]